VVHSEYFLVARVVSAERTSLRTFLDCPTCRRVHFRQTLKEVAAPSGEMYELFYTCI